MARKISVTQLKEAILEKAPELLNTPPDSIGKLKLIFILEDLTQSKTNFEMLKQIRLWGLEELVEIINAQIDKNEKV